MPRTVASNPARIQVQLGHFLRTDGKDLIVLIVALAIGGALLAVNWKPALIVFGIGAFVSVFSILQARDLFLNGDVCPAIVLDPERQLVAVRADLAQGRRPAPVIKVLKQPLQRAVSGPIKKGTRLAFVALYTGHPGQNKWTNFGGYLAQTGTKSSKAVQRVLASIPESEWDALLSGVRELEKPYSPGMYDVGPASGSGESAAAVKRPSPAAVGPMFKIMGAAVLVPVLGLVGLALRAKLQGGANPQPGPLAQGAPNPFPGGPVDPLQNPAAPVPGPAPDGPLRQRPWPMPPGGNAGQPNAPGEGAGAPQPANDADAANPFQPVNPAGAGNPPAEDANPFRPVDQNNADGADNAGDENPFRPRAPANPPVWQAGQQAEGLLAGEWRPVTIKRFVNPGHIEVTWDEAGDVGPPFLPGPMLRPRGNANAGQAPADNAPPVPGKFQAGARAEASWANRWLPVTILQAMPGNQYKIHWEGYSDAFDEVVPADRLRPAS